MHLITTATSPDEANRSSDIAVLPVGSFEQHGAHLPLATDTIVACTIASAVAEAYELFLLPPVTVSCSHEHSAWPGTVSISASTLIAVITDIAGSLQRAGVDKLVLVNGHGGNYTLSNVVQEANVERPRMALYPTRTAWATARDAANLTTSTHDDMHAGELETSLLLHAVPEVVRDGYRDADHLSERPHMLVHGLLPYTATGVVGRPSQASANKGQAILDSLTASFTHTRAALADGERSADTESTPLRSS